MPVKMGSMVSRSERVLTMKTSPRSLARFIPGVVMVKWRICPYDDLSGFCCSAKFDEVEKNTFVLTPGRYVGTADLRRR